MKLDNANSIFNMGDTSIRVKQLVEVNKVILHRLYAFMQADTLWEKNPQNQEFFYQEFIKEIVRIETEDGIELFQDFKRAKNYTPPNPARKGLRGRTLTNSLVKNGFVDSKRTISPVAINYLNQNIKKADKLEAILGLSEDNLIYLRQYLKLRVYDSSTDNYFYNFRFALKFLTKYKNVPQNDFLKILESVKPTQSTTEINNIIDCYREVSENNMLFDEYYKSLFSSTLRSEETLEEVRRMFTASDFSDENFVKYFNNRDSRETSLLYKDFVLEVIKLKETRDIEAFNKVKELSRDNRIKKAFAGGKLPFEFGRNESIQEFLDTNKENPLLDSDHYQIYLEFIFSKHNDLIREYSDMCRRAFKVTGLISFENGIVNLSTPWLITPMLNILQDDFTLNGNDSYTAYEENLDSPWFNDLTLIEILNLSDSTINLILKEIGEEFGETNIENIPELLMNEREMEYREFVDSHFPKERVISILSEIITRSDEAVFKEVTEQTTIPTIYEYLLTIAWYHISKNKDYLLHKSFQVTLDGDKLPLSHRGGGAGDIEVVTNDYSLLLEVTLMDMNTQKRGELEPVIRHTTNFAIENQHSDNIQTIFIANELDNNVLNVFRATQFIELSGTNVKGTVPGLNIFALTTAEVIAILEKGINDLEMLEIIKNHKNSNPIRISTNWRDSIIEGILN